MNHACLPVIPGITLIFMWILFLFFPTTTKITENLGRRKKGMKGADTEVGVGRGGMRCSGLEGGGGVACLIFPIVQNGGITANRQSSIDAIVFQMYCNIPARSG